MHETDDQTATRHQIERAAMQSYPGPWRLTHLATWMQPAPVLEYKILEEHNKSQDYLKMLQRLQPSNTKESSSRISKRIGANAFSVVQVEQVKCHNERKAQERREGRQERLTAPKNQ